MSIKQLGNTVCKYIRRKIFISYIQTFSHFQLIIIFNSFMQTKFIMYYTTKSYIHITFRSFYINYYYIYIYTLSLNHQISK